MTRPKIVFKITRVPYFKTSDFPMNITGLSYNITDSLRAEMIPGVIPSGEKFNEVKLTSRLSF